MSKTLKKAKNDMLAAVLTVLFSIGFYAETYRFKIVNMTNAFDAQFMPRVIAVLVFVCGILLFLQGRRAYSKIPKEQRVLSEAEKKKNKASLIRCVEAFLVMLLGAIAFKKLGFLLTMPWVLFALFCITEKKEKRKYKLYLLLSLLGPIVVFFGFYYGFKSLLPVGVLKPLLMYL